jgi:hypothetical protein
MLFVATWGLFSHNVLDDAFILIGLAIVIGDGHSASMIDEGAT